MRLKEIELPEVDIVYGYLEAVSDFVQTDELKWYFDVRLFEYEGDVSDIALLIKAAYPESQPEKASIVEGSVAKMTDTLNYELGRGLHASPTFTPVLTQYRVLWQYLYECVHYEQSRIFEYTTSEGLDSFGAGGILGNFAFVILDEPQHRCLMLSGGRCD